jgi:transposase InsO family protein
MKYFDEEIRRLLKNHWHTYPKTPKMNAYVERFNRTIQEEFIDYHQELLITPDEFNHRLTRGSSGTTLNDLRRKPSIRESAAQSLSTSSHATCCMPLVAFCSVLFRSASAVSLSG